MENQQIEQLEDHIQGYINDSIATMGFDFFGDDYPWEEEPEVIALRKRIAAIEEQS
tara:strand:+ start:298 stop:465 length:168 start_codon:yes stop_codon:yes gene_type:complete